MKTVPCPPLVEVVYCTVDTGWGAGWVVAWLTWLTPPTMRPSMEPGDTIWYCCPLITTVCVLKLINYFFVLLNIW